MSGQELTLGVTPARVTTNVRSRFGNGSLRHFVEHEMAGLYAEPTPPALCGAAPKGGWVAHPSTHLKDCSRCLAKAKALDQAEEQARDREPTAAELAAASEIVGP